jgi:hypothetical protein
MARGASLQFGAEPSYATAMRRSLGVLGLLLIATATARAGKTMSSDAWLCAIGQFTSADSANTVAIDNGQIAVGACPMTPAKVKAGKKRTVLSARWSGCDGFKGAVRVTAKLTNGT